jgi:hypothetical protein
LRPGLVRLSAAPRDVVPRGAMRTGAQATIPLGPKRLPVVDIRDDDAEQPPVLIVEDMAG